jgi:hypothetical protein
MSIAVLALALVSGIYSRFHGLVRYELFIDEGHSWAAAAAPSVKEVIAYDPQHQGKLAIYYLILHAWMHVFEDSLWWMRALSATFGTINIILVFVVVRDLFLSLDKGSSKSQVEMVAGVAALLVALNPTIISLDQMVRMYSLVLTLESVQLLLFIEAQQTGRMLTCVALTISTVLAIATNYTAVFLFGAEMVWLVYLRIMASFDSEVRRLWLWPGATAVMAGAALVALPILDALKGLSFFVASNRDRAEPVLSGLRWIKPQPVWWPIQMLSDSCGTGVIIFALTGIFSRRQGYETGLKFLLCWLICPFAFVFVISELITPLGVPRYLLASFVALTGLAAFGLVANLKYAPVVAALVAVPFLYFWKAPDYTEGLIQWQEATSIAAHLASGSERIGIAPEYAADIVRYYYPEQRRQYVSGVSSCGSERLLIFGTFDIRYDALRICYRHIVWRGLGVEVRSQS